MIEVAEAGNAGLMGGLLDRMGFGGAARVAVYGSDRPLTTTLVTTVYLAEPAGSILPNGNLSLVPGVQSVVVNASTPKWGRVLNGLGEALFDCDVRLSGAPDLNQEIVLDTPNLAVGALVQIQSGTFSTLP